MYNYYKKILFMMFVIFFMFTVVCFAQPPARSHSITFKWDRNNDEITKGYNIYQASNPDFLIKGQFDYGKDTSTKLNTDGIPQPDPNQDTVTYTINDVPEGHWYWVVTAYNINGTESDPSNIADKIVDYQIVPVPTNLHIYISIDVNTSQSGSGTTK